MRLVSLLAISLLSIAAHATQPEFVQIDPKTKKPIGKSVFLAEGMTITGGTLAVATPTPAPAATPAPKPKTLLEGGFPYVPQKTDYALEMGVWQARDPSLWVGGLIGEHVGKCVMTDSPTCQQYIDLIGAAAVREGETYGLFLLSPRWQYVNFPNRTSPFFRVFGGVSAVNVAAERTWKPAGGVGVGITTYLHHNVDLRAELRAGGVDQSFVLGLLSAHVKTERLLEYFANKLKDLGVGTVKTAIDATGTVIKATGEGVGSAIEGLTPQGTPTPPKK